MKTFNLYNAFMAIPLAAGLMLSSCMDTINPTNVASAEQIQASSNSLSMLVGGLKTKMIAVNSYGNSSGSYYITQDWGYPCYMYVRDVLCEDFPTPDFSWNYQASYEKGSNLTSHTAYPYYYYYTFINNANRLIGLIDLETASEEERHYAGIARVYRALCYYDLSFMFEFKLTGYADLDAKAQEVLGLTVPIVTEQTDKEQTKNNPRAPFYTMYRFIYNDLSMAEELLANYSRSTKEEPNKDVVNALMARFWLTLATRFNQSADDLTEQLAHEGDDDGYKALGITTAKQCYEKAIAYADKVIAAGYSPLTEAQWHDPVTGFNTANQSWVWCMRFSSVEQLPDSWNSIVGQINPEATWAMPAYGGAYRLIGSYLYDRIPDEDWRKTTWIAPEDAGKAVVPSKYQTLLKDENATSLADNTNFSRVPAYAGLKFRSASGDMVDPLVGMLCDVPVIRVEEMYFIKAEALAYTEGKQAGADELTKFVNTYRYTDGSYQARSDYYAYLLDDILIQKRIEFWGEGIVYYDYKRLKKGVLRTMPNTNYPDDYQLNSKDGYVAPWMNFYIPEIERSFNQGIVMNPDCTPTVQQYCTKDAANK